MKGVTIYDGNIFKNSFYLIYTIPRAYFDPTEFIFGQFIRFISSTSTAEMRWSGKVQLRSRRKLLVDFESFKNDYF